MPFSGPFNSLRDILNDVYDSVNRALRVESVGSAPGTSTQVQGAQASGTPANTENPVLVAGQNGGNVTVLGVSSTGGVNQGDPNAGGTSSWPVQGAAANGAAVAGSPVLTGGSDGANARSLSVDTGGRQIVVGGAAAGAAVVGNPVIIAFTDGSNNVRNVGISGTADASSAAANALMTQGLGYTFNGTTWDRQRNNIDVTLLASASRTTTQTSADITTYNLSGISVFLNMTVVGTGSVTVTINGKDPASGVYYNILTGAAVVTNVGNLYRVMPGIPAVANKDVNAYLPRIIQIVVTANNANPATYSVGYTLHNP